MAVYTFDPLEDRRWSEFVDGSPSASVFHTCAWVTALRRTYGYVPVVYTTSPPDAALTNGILLCQVRSWLTGRRLVSVPFADHCQPLVDRPEDRAEIVAALRAATEGEWRYVEFRPTTFGAWESAGLAPSVEYRLHALDLRGSAAEAFDRLHESAIQRRIRRAERDAVRYEEGRSRALLDAFCALMLLTRRRHRVPPQPREWFTNLAEAFGDSLKIRVAFWGTRPAAGMLTLQHGNTLVYKYGCSNADLHHLGVMPFLFWTAIEQAVGAGLKAFDLGRSDLDNPGLITFKERLGAVPSTLTYFRWPPGFRRAQPRGMKVASRILAHAPDFLFTRAGRLLYRHIG